MQGDLAPCLLKFYMRQWCLLHQLHIITKTQLSLLATHYSEVAILVNVWRSTHVALRIFAAWKDLYGIDRATQACKRLPCKAISGRWGAIHNSEAYIMNCGQTDTAAIIPLVLAPAPRKKARQ